MGCQSMMKRDTTPIRYLPSFAIAVCIMPNGVTSTYHSINDRLGSNNFPKRTPCKGCFFMLRYIIQDDRGIAE